MSGQGIFSLNPELPVIDPEEFKEAAEDADRRLDALCDRLGVARPYLGEPLNAVYVRLLEKLADYANYNHEGYRRGTN